MPPLGGPALRPHLSPNVTGECPHSLLILQGNALLSFKYYKGTPSFPSSAHANRCHTVRPRHKLTVELWPDASKRPVLFGPDPHSLHAATGSQLAWIGAWLDGCKRRGVPVCVHLPVQILQGNALISFQTLQGNALVPFQTIQGTALIPF